MKSKKNIYSVLTLIVFALLFWASVAQQKITTPLVVPTFDFSPPSSVEPGSAGLKIALFDPIYPGNFAFSNKSPFKQFRSSMGKDFEEILTARGYTVKGPYEAYDLMTYSDKTECELGLFADIDMNIDKTSGGWRFTPQGAYGKGFSRYEGTLTISGKITLYVSETFTKQKLIVKSLPIPQTDITVKSEGTYEGFQSEKTIPMDDPEVHNPIANALKEFYQSTMKRAWDLLPKEDLIRVKNQVPQIRKEAGFIKS
jgi:neuraminyllactose-binding hemagglutinin